MTPIFAFRRNRALYSQHILQSTAIDATTTTSGPPTYVRVVHDQQSWPLGTDIDFSTANDGTSEQATTVDQELHRTLDVGLQGYPARRAQLDRTMKTADTLDFDANGALTAHSGQGSAQTYTYVDPFGACYDRAVTTAAGVLVSIVDGASCPSGVNALSWFDAFHTYASVLTGATVQILP